MIEIFKNLNFIIDLGVVAALISAAGAAVSAFFAYKINGFSVDKWNAEFLPRIILYFEVNTKKGDERSPVNIVARNVGGSYAEEINIFIRNKNIKDLLLENSEWEAKHIIRLSNSGMKIPFLDKGEVVKSSFGMMSNASYIDEGIKCGSIFEFEVNFKCPNGVLHYKRIEAVYEDREMFAFGTWMN